MPELKPCPFCGGKAKLCTDRPIGVSPCMIKPHVECTECTASMYASSAIQVVEAWNRRVTDDGSIISDFRNHSGHNPGLCIRQDK